MNLNELVGYFKDDLFLPEIKADTKESVLEELVEPLLKNDIIKNKRVILETLKKRETLGSTGIGHGVAIPHCRTLAVSNVQLVVGHSEQGIVYKSMDGEPVHLFFLIVAPPQEKSNLYLPILGKLVEMLRDKDLRKRLQTIHDFNEFVTVFQGG
ncbi:PTS sugar transporter subunit IIA [bacterium]|nr:PTS sugar transporter subunit IIA [bacterium]